MINYRILADSLEYYESLGYNRIEVPWMVTESIDSITRPTEIEPLHLPVKNKNLIASGEQGFLYLNLKQYINQGKYVTLTPCFRTESYDFTHSKTFMKTELIVIAPDKEKENQILNSVLHDALNFFKKIVGNKYEGLIEIRKIDDISYDIDINVDGEMIELGSYGIRSYKYMRWIYGTGCAEPRLTRIIKTLDQIK